MGKRVYCKYFKILLMEVTDMNWDTGIKGQIMAFWSLKYIISYGSWVLLLLPLIPSLSHPWSCSGRKVSFLGSISDPLQTGNFLEDQTAVLWRLGLDCCTFLWVIFDHSFVGVMLKESSQWQLFLRWMNVHTADLKKTTLHWTNFILST